jgi:hypothetical protein
MSLLLDQRIEVETRFSTDVKGTEIRHSELVKCIKAVGFSFQYSQTVVKTLYKAGDRTLHHLYNKDTQSSDYYYKKTRSFTSAEDVVRIGYRTAVSVETPTFPGEVKNKRPKDEYTRKEDIYALNDVKLFVRRTKPLTVEIELELDDDDVLIREAVMTLESLTERILTCLSFDALPGLNSLYVTATEYDVISSIIARNIKMRIRPVPLKWTHLTTTNISDYFVSRKADGLRVYLLVLRNLGVFVVFGVEYVSYRGMIKISNVTPTFQVDDLLLEGELMDPNDMLTPTQKHTIILHDIVSNAIYSNKITRLYEYADLLSYLPVDLMTKYVKYTGSSRESIMSAIADVFGYCSDMFSTNIRLFNDDGIMFTPNMPNEPIYKWKPPGNMTIDLLFLDGKLVYGSRNTEYKGRYDTSIVMDNNTVHEFLVNNDMSLVYIRPRPDRRNPNGYRVVQDMVNLAYDPMTEDDLLGITPGVYRKYHNTRKRDLLKHASRRGNTLLDIGSGKGGSLSSYIDYNTVIVVDPKPEYMDKMILRAEKMGISAIPFLPENVTYSPQTTVYYYVGYMDSTFMSYVIELELIFNVVSSFFTLQYLDPLAAVQLYKVDEQTAFEQVETLKHIISDRMARGSAFIGISPDHKPDMKRIITRERLCRGYVTQQGEPIATHAHHEYIDDDKAIDLVIGTFNIPGLPTLEYGHEDYIPKLDQYLGLFVASDKLASVDITPLYAKHLITSMEWIDLSYYYSSFILAERRPVNEEVSTQDTILRVSSTIENSIHYSLLTLNGETMYEIGVLNGSLDACILTVLYKKFTHLLSRSDELRTWSSTHKGDDKTKVEMVQDRYGIGLIIVKVKGGNVVTLTPSNANLSRYMYVFADDENYCLLMTKQGPHYQSMYTDLSIIKLAL